MSNIRLEGRPEKLGSASVCNEFLTWEVPDVDSEKRMRRLLKRMGKSAVVLDQAKYGGVDFGDRAHASFIEQPGFAAGRDQSAHQVRFGQFILNGMNFREQPDFVAIKPYDERPSLYREWAAHEYLNSLFDDQAAFINLGVYKDPSGVEAIISQYDHDVISFDSSFWADESSPSSALRPDILQRHANLGAESLGLMHGVRMTHGDAQVKNLAADRRGVRLIDLESADILNEEAIDHPVVIAQTRKDLSAFISSMGQVEENRQKVIEALSSDAATQRIVDSYVYGVKRGRAALDGEYVPDFGKINEYAIREELEKLAV